MDPAVESALIAECRQGNRDAFRPLVEQYQSLVCALSYSASGNVCLSEDIAQETFLIAWKQLPQLREPGRFKAWLCGIARNLIQNHLRRDRRAGQIESVEGMDQIGDPNPHPSESAIRREEEALVWQALSAIPEGYREPIVMYYRQDQSIAAVAASLELSEVTVRQRLSRGRALLREHVAALVESTLTRTRPGASLTVSTLALIPSTPAKVAIAVGSMQGLVSGVSKGTALAKWALLGPWIFGSLGFLLGLQEERRFTAANPPSPALRRVTTRVRWLGLLGTLMLGLVLGPSVALRSLQKEKSPYPTAVEFYLRATNPAWIGLAIPVLFVGWMSWAGRAILRQQQEDQVAAQRAPTDERRPGSVVPVGPELRLGRLAVSMMWPSVLFASLSLKTPNIEAGLVVLTVSAGMVALCCFQCLRARSWRRPVIGAAWLGLLAVLLVAVHLYLPAWRLAGIVEAKWTPARTEWILVAFFGLSAMSWRRYFDHRPLIMPIPGKATLAT